MLTSNQNDTTSVLYIKCSIVIAIKNVGKIRLNRFEKKLVAVGLFDKEKPIPIPDKKRKTSTPAHRFKQREVIPRA